MEIKKQRLRLLTEANREVNLSVSRLSHKSNARVDLTQARDILVNTLKNTAKKRQSLMSSIDLKELWELLNAEQEWIDLPTMTEYFFSDTLTADHESAVIRSFFCNRIYFKFNKDSFLPNTEQQVQNLIAQSEEEERRNRLIDQGAKWLKYAYAGKKKVDITDAQPYIDVLTSYYLFEKESPHYALGKAMLAKAGIKLGDHIFDFLVRIGVWKEDENLNLHLFNIKKSFPEAVMQATQALLDKKNFDRQDPLRKDLTRLPLMTIDGQSTRDYDDALSLEKDGKNYVLGIHIVDVAHFIEKGSPIDQVAHERGSSIYMPDEKISMLPSLLSENLCSLIADEVRPAISVFIVLNRFLEEIQTEIIPSFVAVKQRLSYSEANKIMESDECLSTLYKIGQRFRQNRLDSGALQINLPEINVWLEESGEIVINKVDRESPSRLFIAEMMIKANEIMANLLVTHKMPAIFRSQPEPKARLFKNGEGTLFQNYMQRRHINRVVISQTDDYHSGLGLKAYVTATSPIRRYFDLVTQRQLRAILGLEAPYTEEEVCHLIQTLDQPLAEVYRTQYARRRYWILKYLEGKTGSREEALVLEKRKDYFSILLKEYMLECKLPQSSGADLKPQDLIQVVIQHVNARKDVLSVFMG